MDADLQCFCGSSVGTRQDLIDHNMRAHGWSEEESRRAVTEKYGEG